MDEAQSYAEMIFEIIRGEFDDAAEEAKKQGKEVRLECVTDFGQLIVSHISAGRTSNLMRIQVQHSDKSASVIFVDAHRCSFRLFFVSKEQGKMIVGFSTA